MRRRDFLMVTAAGLATPLHASLANMILQQQEEAVRGIDQYPLIDAMLKGRSRRFFRDAKMPGGPLKYESKKKKQPLTIEQEALMAFAAGGITGYAIADLPYHKGRDGHGNTMIQLVGRTIGSADAAHTAAMFITNDDGTWLLRRPQDLTPEEAGEIIALFQSRKWVRAYEKLRVRISNRRTRIPRSTIYQPTFNLWAANRPGTTYFIPVLDLSALYLAAVFQILNEDHRFMIADDKNGWVPAGLEGFKISNGGYLPDHPTLGVWAPMSRIETMVGQLATVEIGGMVQNLRLMAQALGIGGFPHSAGTIAAWQSALRFTRTWVPASKLQGKEFEDLMGFDVRLPNYVGLERDGKVLIKSYCPPYHDTMYEAVRAYLDFKFGPKGKLRDDGTPTAWKDPVGVKSQIPMPEQKVIDAVCAHAQYIHDTFGRFPAFIGPTTTVIAYQAHVLDPAFYEEFYKTGSMP